MRCNELTNRAPAKVAAAPKSKRGREPPRTGAGPSSTTQRHSGTAGRTGGSSRKDPPQWRRATRMLGWTGGCNKEVGVDMLENG